MVDEISLLSQLADDKLSEVKLCNKSVASESVSENRGVSVSTQTEDKFPSTNSVRESSSNMVMNQNSSTVKESDCSCKCNHKMISPLGCRIFLDNFVHVLARKPLRIIQPSPFICCPFLFDIETKLIDHGNNSGDKMFRVIVKCDPAYGAFLPPSSFKYQIWLTNREDDSKNRTTQEVWNYPIMKSLTWDVILYSQLINPQRKWIVKKIANECLEIILKLMRW